MRFRKGPLFLWYGVEVNKLRSKSWVKLLSTTDAFGSALGNQLSMYFLPLSSGYSVNSANFWRHSGSPIAGFEFTSGRIPFMSLLGENISEEGKIIEKINNSQLTNSSSCRNKLNKYKINSFKN